MLQTAPGGCTLGTVPSLRVSEHRGIPCLGRTFKGILCNLGCKRGTPILGITHVALRNCEPLALGLRLKVVTSGLAWEEKSLGPKPETLNSLNPIYYRGRNDY